MRATKVAVPLMVAAGAVLITLTVALARPRDAALRRGVGAAAVDSLRVSAGLLRRLAAAADGYRTDEPVWVVAASSEPYAIVGVFPSRADAVRAQTRGSAVFGPYVTPRDYGREAVFVPVKHRPPTIYGDTIRSTAWRLPERPWLMIDVDSVVITGYHRSGATWRGSSRGDDIDAVFFTLSAQDKFVFPYYAQLSGLDVTTRMREGVAAYIRMAPEGPTRR